MKSDKYVKNIKIMQSND